MQVTQFNLWGWKHSV